MQTFFYDTLEDYCCVFLRDMYDIGTVYHLCTSSVPFCLKHPMGRMSDLSWYATRAERGVGEGLDKKIDNRVQLWYCVPVVYQLCTILFKIVRWVGDRTYYGMGASETSLDV
uniref:AlNc14C352G10913 protein n=1 Tax=Albugo laibachii Nc14 TaxID=890382 RepID=F0WXG3_9STRA|nr:AlNc14C352G10913 [Albugo laibachii Nc14]|eukprot:CCA26155.1 AlNc14C352G10913 [Albugo laibachii Nc14]